MRQLLTSWLRREAAAAAAAVLGTLCLSACGGGGGGPAPNPITFHNFDMSLSGFAEHVGQRAEFYVTDSSNFLWIAAIYDPLPSANLNLLCRDSLRDQRNYNCSIWIDENADGIHDNAPTDPNWVKPIPATGIFSFMHDENDVNFDPANFDRDGRTGDFHFNAVAGLDAEDVGMSFEARVIDTKSGRTVGVYHLGAVPAETFSVSIPDIINASTYQVDFYLDENGNGRYDAPPVDHAWRRTATTVGAGDLTINFTHDMDFTDIGL